MIKEHILKKLLKVFYADWLSTNDIYSPTHYCEIDTYLTSEFEIEDSERELYAAEIKKHFNAFTSLTTDWPSHKKRERSIHYDGFQPLTIDNRTNFPEFGRKVKLVESDGKESVATLVKKDNPYGRTQSICFQLENGLLISEFPANLLWSYIY